MPRRQHLPPIDPAARPGKTVLEAAKRFKVRPADVIASALINRLGATVEGVVTAGLGMDDELASQVIRSLGAKAGYTKRPERAQPDSVKATPSTTTSVKRRKLEGKKKPPAAKKPRERNPMYDAVAEVTGAGGSFVGKCMVELAEAVPPYTPDEVLDFGRRFHQLCNWAAKGERYTARPTVGILAKFIGLVRDNPLVKKEPERPAGTYDPSAPQYRGDRAHPDRMAIDEGM